MVDGNVYHPYAIHLYGNSDVFYLFLYLYCPTFFYCQGKQIIPDFSINTQVIIQNRALSLARYLGLSADNHLDGQNGCQ